MAIEGGGVVEEAGGAIVLLATQGLLTLGELRGRGVPEPSSVLGGICLLRPLPMFDHLGERLFGRPSLLQLGLPRRFLETSIVGGCQFERLLGPGVGLPGEGGLGLGGLRLGFIPEGGSISTGARLRGLPSLRHLLPSPLGLLAGESGCLLRRQSSPRRLSQRVDLLGRVGRYGNLRRLVEDLDAQSVTATIERGARLPQEVGDPFPAHLRFGLGACAPKAFQRVHVLRHVCDDGFELGDCGSELPGLQELRGMLEGGGDGNRPGDLSLQAFDPGLHLPLERVQRLHARSLVDHRDLRRSLRRRPEALGEGRLKLLDLMDLIVKTAPDLLRLFDHSPRHLLQLDPHAPEVREAHGLILLHRAFHDRDELRREGGVEPVERCGLLGAKLLEQMDGIVAGEGGTQAEELVADGADGIHVGAGIGAAADLFGGDVAQGAHDEASPRETGLGGGHLGDAKVEDFHLTVAEKEDIAGLDVAVDDALLVRVVQTATDLSHDGDFVFQGQRLALGDEAAELVTVEELHDDEEAAVVLAHVVDGDDVGVAEAGAGLGFTEKAGAELVGDLDLGGDDLEGDGAVEDGVMGFVDHAHAAAADAPEDMVLTDLLGHGVATA